MCFDATGSCLFWFFFHFWNSYYSGAGTQEWLFVESGAPKWESTSLRLAGMDERVATPTPKFATPSPALLRPEPYIKIRWALSEGCMGRKSDRKKKRRREFKQCHFELSSSGGSHPLALSHEGPWFTMQMGSLPAEADWIWQVGRTRLLF